MLFINYRTQRRRALPCPFVISAGVGPPFCPPGLVNIQAAGGKGIFAGSCPALRLLFSTGGSGEIKLSANDTVVSSICSNNFYNSAGIAWFVPINGGISCAVTGCTDNKTSLSGFCGTCKTVAWTTINKIMIKGDSNAGAAAILFGVKK